MDTLQDVATGLRAHGPGGLCAWVLVLSWGATLGLMQGICSLVLTLISIVWVAVQIASKLAERAKRKADGIRGNGKPIATTQ